MATTKMGKMQRERDVFQRRQVRQQMMKLEDEADFIIAITREPRTVCVCHREITKPDASIVRCFEAAEQMKQMANQLQQMANEQQNPQAQQQIQQQLQQAGLNKQQAQQAQQLMQQAAQGDKQAQKQLSKITGVTPFAVAATVQRALGGPTLPIDESNWRPFRSGFEASYSQPV